MKTFITFIAIFMVGVTCMVYETDILEFQYAQETVKQISEEAACQAALELDYLEYAEGRLVFDKRKANLAAGNYIEDSVKLLKDSKPYTLSYAISFEDDDNGYSALNTYENPSVTVSVVLMTDDFFRLPFLKLKTITRESKYELKEP